MRLQTQVLYTYQQLLSCVQYTRKTIRLSQIIKIWSFVNPLVRVSTKRPHTERNLQLRAAGLFKHA